MAQALTGVSFSSRAPSVTGWMENTLCSVSTAWHAESGSFYGIAAKINGCGLLFPSPSIVPAEVFVQPGIEMCL